jgi:cytochrome c553
VVRVARILAALAAFLLSAESALADSIETKERLCASCHGAHGLPTDPSVPIIWGQQSAYILKQLNDYRNGDRNNQIMSSIAESLSEGDLAQMAAYFSNAKWPPRPASTPLPAAPEAIATCQACHHPNLAGGVSPSGVAPRLAGQFSPYLIDTMTAYADGERTNSTLMLALMQSLTPADRKAIAEYLAAMH